MIEQGTFSLALPIEQLGLPSYLQKLPPDQKELVTNALDAVANASLGLPRRDQDILVCVFATDEGVPLLVIRSSFASNIRVGAAGYLPKMSTVMKDVDYVNPGEKIPGLSLSRGGRSIRVGFVEN